MADEKWVYTFDEIDLAEKECHNQWDEVRGLLGGKGANLGEMTRIGVPVPPGFTVTTRGCLAYLDVGAEFPEGMWDQISDALARIEESADRKFGDPAKPLLVSCRSGAKFSMPGMMDTILDIGLNDEVVAGLAEMSGDEHFAQDAYRRLIQMFGSVVFGVRDEVFEDILSRFRARRGVDSDTDLTTDDLREIIVRFRKAVPQFPDDPMEQLRLATESVFKSWNGKRAIAYRDAAGIAHDLGTAVNIQTMVFGNLGNDSATGVAMSRNATTGERSIEGDFLVNAQGEDVVAGIRATRPVSELGDWNLQLWEEFQDIARRLESHYRNMQDIEFTIERGKLWILQTRNGKRTAQAEVRIAVDQTEEGLITKREAVERVDPAQVDVLLHPRIPGSAKAKATLLAAGLNVSPGAAIGVAAFDADLAERWGKEGRKVIMVRPETKPDDVHGMLASEGILTSRGGRTSHAALVARQFGKPAVVGVAELQIDLVERVMRVGDTVVAEGDWLSLDGSAGEVYLGELEALVPDLEDQWLVRLLSWADEFRTLGVRANADYPADANRARTYGASGIGLCRTEHMFFETERLPVVRRMITARSSVERREALDELMPLQRSDFQGLFEAMDGLPVIIRLLDPPLHEFLPGWDELNRAITDHKIRLAHATTLDEIDGILEELSTEERMLRRVEALRESNPMLGLRGVRLGVLMPEITRMQVRAIFEAACAVAKAGGDPKPEVMIPLVSHVGELARQREVLEAEAKEVMEEQEIEVEYLFGTMVETPRAALTTAELSEYAQFFSFGTNDLTQMTFGISRDDAESGFLVEYVSGGILPANPFATLDEPGVGRLMEIAIEGARGADADAELGVCGEHGGEPASIDLCHRLGLDYVSCSPFRVPVARLAAAQAALRHGDGPEVEAASVEGVTADAG